MSKITLKGNAINTSGELPTIGSTAADFKLIAETSEEPIYDLALASL
jgi:peroxiredoxin|tara:strand:+ start:967 stop:1107 length:141 start_codon:yes stop_codon:yes gene_type:complete